MSCDFSKTERIIQEAFPAVPAAQLCVCQGSQPLYSRAFGFLDPQTRQHPADDRTRFDLASITKLLTTTAFMTLVEQAKVDLDQPVRDVLPAFNGLRPVAPYEDPLQEGAFVDVSDGYQGMVDASLVTFRRLLTHTSGLPACRPLYLLSSGVAARWTVLTSYFSYQTGKRVVYSDLGLILVGMAVERITGQRLDEAIRVRVILPLGLTDTGFIPTTGPLPPELQANIAPTEICRWRKRRLIGEVDDENCGRLGGIAGHAGVFSTAMDLAAFGRSYLKNSPVLKPETIVQMTRLQAGDRADDPRGIGFDLWRLDPEYFVHPFSQNSFGHTGFTGASLWIDPARDLVVALLTNEVYHGRADRKISQMRTAVHQAVVEAADGGA
jgi:CubicO group peptidase (beta-lactamase class C family)